MKSFVDEINDGIRKQKEENFMSSLNIGITHLGLDITKSSEEIKKSLNENSISTNNLTIVGILLSLSLVCIGYSQTIISIAEMGENFNWLLWLILGIIIIIICFLLFVFIIFKKRN